MPSGSARATNSTNASCRFPRAQFHDVLENYIRWRRQFLDEHGELLPRFQQPPMVASFMRDERRSTQREQIPVPKGPVEVW
jgi:tRNA-dihydrouridine synthase B